MQAVARTSVRRPPPLDLTVSICGNDWGPSRPRRQERDGTPNKSVKPKSSSIPLGREAGGAGELNKSLPARACPPPSGIFLGMRLGSQHYSKQWSAKKKKKRGGGGTCRRSGDGFCYFLFFYFNRVRVEYSRRSEAVPSARTNYCTACVRLCQRS